MEEVTRSIIFLVSRGKRSCWSGQTAASSFSCSCLDVRSLEQLAIPEECLGPSRGDQDQVNHRHLQAVQHHPTSPSSSEEVCTLISGDSFNSASDTQELSAANQGSLLGAERHEGWKTLVLRDRGRRGHHSRGKAHSPPFCRAFLLESVFGSVAVS